MANNFEIVFPREEGKILNTDKGILNIDNIVKILEEHNCLYVISPHEIDDNSSFLHYHVGIHTESNNDYSTIAKWFGLPNNSVQKIRGKFTSTYLLYIVHQDKNSILKGKTPVDVSNVISNFDIDFESLIDNTRKKEIFDDKLDKLALGLISEYDLYKNEDINILRRRQKDINNALITRSKKAMVENKERNMEVVYITGEARTGKSYLAKRMAKDVGSVYITSNGQNPFDDYMGQDAVIIDDIRASDFKFNEFLKITDNHMSAKVSARYHNIDLNCKVMYLTSIVPINEFYANLQKDVKEASEQIKGRIGMMIKVRKKTYDVYIYDDERMDYEIIAKNIPNPLLNDKDILLMNKQERKNTAINMLKGISDLTKHIIDNIEDDEYMDIEDGENPFDEMK